MTQTLGCGALVLERDPERVSPNDCLRTDTHLSSKNNLPANWQK